MLVEVVEIFLASASTAAAVYGAVRARSAERAAEASRQDTRAVLGSLGYAHGSLEVISAQLQRQRLRGELPTLERLEWTPLPKNDTSAD